MEFCTHCSQGFGGSGFHFQLRHHGIPKDMGDSGSSTSLHVIKVEIKTNLSINKQLSEVSHSAVSFTLGFPPHGPLIGCLAVLADHSLLPAPSANTLMTRTNLETQTGHVLRSAAVHGVSPPLSDRDSSMSRLLIYFRSFAITCRGQELFDFWSWAGDTLILRCHSDSHSQQPVLQVSAAMLHCPYHRDTAAQCVATHRTHHFLIHTSQQERVQTLHGSLNAGVARLVGPPTGLLQRDSRSETFPKA